MSLLPYAPLRPNLENHIYPGRPRKDKDSKKNTHKP